MTLEEKISKLNELKVKNRINLFGFSCGLCSLYNKIKETNNWLEEDIPDITKFKKIDFSHTSYWWTTSGAFKPWYDRHVAINKTIKLLKQQLNDSKKNKSHNV